MPWTAKKRKGQTDNSLPFPAVGKSSPERVRRQWKLAGSSRLNAEVQGSDEEQQERFPDEESQQKHLGDLEGVLMLPGSRIKPESHGVF